MRGGGSAIGRGRQHTTREVFEYWWPPESRLLRIVDTPGVEGLEGAKLAAMAKKFVERSDHIFFVLSNDAATSGELEYFRNISTKGKSVTCILNVKEMDIDVLLEAPEYVFREDELDGHRRRICRYLEQNVGLDEIPILPVHAMVDSILADKTAGSELSKRVGKLMKRHSVDESANRFEATLRLELTKALDEQVKVASFEASHGIDLNKAENALARVYSLREAESIERWKRVSVRAGAAASALAGWVVLNWWNPSGWVAGLAAVGVAAVGTGAQAVAKKVTNNWSAANARELSDQRECTIDGVRAAILNKKNGREVPGSCSACRQRVSTAPQSNRPSEAALFSLWGCAR